MGPHTDRLLSGVSSYSYNELVRRENNREAASARVRVWVAAANVELTLWRTSPDKVTPWINAS